jgi:adenosylcobinamide-GDP ribazoletransferase
VAALWPTALLLALLRLDLLAPVDLIAVVAVTAAVGLSTGAWYRARLGGVTGDLLGATQQVTEIGVLMVLAFSWT